MHPNLYNAIKSNPIALRQCIQYEVLLNKPPFESYRTFCKAMGDDVMDYPEFEFWYMRFYNGKMDLDYDRSQDKEPLTFSELPIEVIDRVVKKLKPSERNIVRLLSQTLRCLCDKQKLDVKRIAFFFSEDHASHGIDYNYTTYKKTENGCSIDYNGTKFNVKGVHYLKMTLNDIKLYLTNPEIPLKSFHFSSDFGDECLEIMEKMAENYKAQFYVKKLTAYNITLLGSALKLLKPGVLEYIEMGMGYDRGIEMGENVSNSEQWKQAKVAEFRLWGTLPPTDISHFYHFEAFNVHLESYPRDVMVDLRNNIYKSSSFRKCYLIATRPSELAVARAVFEEVTSINIRSQVVYDDKMAYLAIKRK